MGCSINYKQFWYIWLNLSTGDVELAGPTEEVMELGKNFKNADGKVWMVVGKRFDWTSPVKEKHVKETKRTKTPVKVTKGRRRPVLKVHKKKR